MRLCAARGRIIERLLPPPLRTNPGCRLLNRNAILPLAGLGYSVEGLDVSAAQITRAERECAVRGLHCKFRVDDMRTLATVRLSSYAAVMAMDNALPHSESDNDIAAALTAMRSRLLPRGKVILSIRDYDSPIAMRGDRELCFKFGIAPMSVATAYIYTLPATHSKAGLPIIFKAATAQ